MILRVKYLKQSKTNWWVGMLGFQPGYVCLQILLVRATCYYLSILRKPKLWNVLLIVTNIHHWSTSKYKGSWTSCTLEVKYGHVNGSDRHHFWAKAFNCLDLTLQSSLFLPEQSWKSRVKVEPTLALLWLDMSCEQDTNICFMPLRYGAVLSPQYNLVFSD